MVSKAFHSKSPTKAQAHGAVLLAKLGATVFAGAFTLLANLAPARAETRAQAHVHVHALVIGNNAGFSRGSSAAPSAPLRYADDDAVAFEELITPVADATELLTVMDRETQALHPELTSVARIPTREAVRGAVARLAERVRQTQAAGQRTAVFVFFSGHGTVDDNGRPALALADGGLDQAFLYDEVLAKLPADELHLLIDACHAEAVVRPRDVEAQAVPVSSAQADAFLVEHTLARFPNAGAIVAASVDAKAHEWDAVRHGIFTHELLSALRGAADVNRDRRLEYSEVYAFMSAANREIGDPRARLAIVARPPDVNRRAPLLALSDFPTEHTAWLAGVPGHRGAVEVEDGRGRVATVHGDRDFSADVLVPAGSLLYVRNGEQEARFTAVAGESVPFTRLRFAPASLRDRGPLEDAVRGGLFAAEYGRRYYEGIVDQTPGFLPVDFTNVDQGSAETSVTTEASQSSRALFAAAGLSNGVADIVTITHGLALGLRPLGQHGLALSAAGLADSEGSLSEWRVKANAGYLFCFGHGPVRGYAGGLVGGGIMGQKATADSTRKSGFVDAAPVLGVSANGRGPLGLWAELDLSGVLYQRDDSLAFSFMPSAWLGASWRL